MCFSTIFLICIFFGSFDGVLDYKVCVFFSLFIILSLFDEVIDFDDNSENNTFDNWACKIAAARAGNHRWTDSCCLIRWSTCKTPMVISLSNVSINYISWSVKDLNRSSVVLSSLFYNIILGYIFKKIFLVYSNTFGISSW